MGRNAYTITTAAKVVYGLCDIHRVLLHLLYTYLCARIADKLHWRQSMYYSKCAPEIAHIPIVTGAGEHRQGSAFAQRFSDVRSC